MKRKAALLLAVVMSVSMALSAFANTASTIVNDYGSSSVGRTIFVEKTAQTEGVKIELAVPRPWTRFNAWNPTGSLSGDRGDIGIVQIAPQLEVALVGGIVTGTQFIIELEGGDWALHNAWAGNNGGPGGINYPNYQMGLGLINAPVSSSSTNRMDQIVKHFDGPYGVSGAAGNVILSEATSRGQIWAENAPVPAQGGDGPYFSQTAGNISADDGNGMYVQPQWLRGLQGLAVNEVGHPGMYARYGTAPLLRTEVQSVLNELAKQIDRSINPSGWVQWMRDSYEGTNGTPNVLPAMARTVSGKEELAYTMIFIDSKTAIVTVLQGTPSTNYSAQNAPILSIPMLVVCDVGATVRVRGVQGLGDGAIYNLRDNFNFPWTEVIRGRTTGTTMTISPNIINRELFPITTIKIQETRLGSLSSHGWFTLESDPGFEFVSNYVPDAALLFGATYNGITIDATNINQWIGLLIGDMRDMWSLSVNIGGRFDIPLFRNYNGGDSTWQYQVWGNPIENFTGQNMSPSGLSRVDRNNGTDSYRHGITADVRTGNEALGYARDMRDGGGNLISGTVGPFIDYIYFPVDRNGNPDYTSARLHITGLNPTTAVQGAVTFTNVPLMLRAETNAPTGDVFVTVKNGGGTDALGNCSAGVSNQDRVKVGERREWAISFKRVPELPYTIWNGQYENRGEADRWHQTATIEFRESVANHWQANKKTVFEVPEGVKIIKAQFGAVTGFVYPAALGTVSGHTFYPRYSTPAYSSSGTPNVASYVEITERQVIIQGMPQSGTYLHSPQGFTMQLWVSVESGWGKARGEGVPIELSVTGESLPIEYAKSATGVAAIEYAEGGPLAPVVIARAFDPVIIDVVEVGNIQIGNQILQTSDFTVTENRFDTAGFVAIPATHAAIPLRKGDTVKVSVADNTDTGDVGFYREPFYEVIEGTLGIGNKRFESFANLTAYSSSLTTIGRGGTIHFDITTASRLDAPGVIEFTGVEIKIDRTSPETNVPFDGGYDILVWGDAIALNFNEGWGTFRTQPGIREAYLRVGPIKGPSLLDARVEVTIGEEEYRVNGRSYPMGASAYIDPDTDSTMVPVRFIASALAGYADLPDSENSPVKWDDELRMVTIFAPSADGSVSVIQFFEGQDFVIVNGGEPQTMHVYDADGFPTGATVSAYLNEDEERIYIPFRWLGNVLGVPVAWDEETETAIYNPQVTY